MPKVKPARIPWTIALAAGALLLLAACSSGDDDSGGNGPGESQPPTSTPVRTASPEEEAYFQRIEIQLQASAEVGASLNAARAAAFDATKPEDQRIQGGLDFSATYANFMTERETRLAAIVSPPSIDALHQALIASTVGTQALASDLKARVEASPVADEATYSALFGELDGVTLIQRFRDACLGLQTRAQQLRIIMDLRCNG